MTLDCFSSFYTLRPEHVGVGSMFASILAAKKARDVKFGIHSAHIPYDVGVHLAICLPQSTRVTTFKKKKKIMLKSRNFLCFVAKGRVSQGQSAHTLRQCLLQCVHCVLVVVSLFQFPLFPVLLLLFPSRFPCRRIWCPPNEC